MKHRETQTERYTRYSRQIESVVANYRRASQVRMMRCRRKKGETADQRDRRWLNLEFAADKRLVLRIVKMVEDFE